MSTEITLEDTNNEPQPVIERDSLTALFCRFVNQCMIEKTVIRGRKLGILTGYTVTEFGAMWLSREIGITFIRPYPVPLEMEEYVLKEGCMCPCVNVGVSGEAPVASSGCGRCLFCMLKDGWDLSGGKQ